MHFRFQKRLFSAKEKGCGKRIPVLTFAVRCCIICVGVSPGGTPKWWRLLPFMEGSEFLFSLLLWKGGDIMYLTLEQLMLLGGFIVALLQVVLTFTNKKK
jgi:hypothetical protein